MIDDKKKIPVRVVVKKAKGHGGSHGGAWKVAYADFVTAMMALFIVLWIVGQNNQVKQMVSEYFKDPVAFEQKVRSGGILPDAPPAGSVGPAPPLPTKENEKEEMKRLEEEAKKLEGLIKATPLLDKFKGQVEITVTEEGLRIELVDNSSSLFFDVGSARMKPETVELLGIIASEIGKLPNRVVVEGYTDSRPYVAPGYSNWELSVDRANSARKILSEKGMGKNQIHQVRGFADRKLKRPDNPTDYSNRRVSILVGPNAPAGAPGVAGPKEAKAK
jgi:chemotaxis protein MotB